MNNKGGGYTSQIYAIRQAISRGIISYNQKYIDFFFQNEF